MSVFHGLLNHSVPFFARSVLVKSLFKNRQSIRRFLFSNYYNVSETIINML